MSRQLCLSETRVRISGSRSVVMVGKTCMISPKSIPKIFQMFQIKSE